MRHTFPGHRPNPCLATGLNNKAITCLEKIVLKCAKMHVFENTKFGMKQKAHIFISRLPSLNLFHILTRDTESNHLKQKKKIIIIN